MNITSSLYGYRLRFDLLMLILIKHFESPYMLAVIADGHIPACLYPC